MPKKYIMNNNIKSVFIKNVFLDIFLSDNEKYISAYNHFLNTLS